MTDDVGGGLVLALLLVVLLLALVGEFTHKPCERLDSAGYPPSGCPERLMGGEL